MRILIALFALTVAACAAELDTDKFLEALALKETGLTPDAVGPRGELSRWQIMPVVWHQHMQGEPFRRAKYEARARLCAVRHLAWLRARIVAAGHEPTPERLATCWHYGASHRRRPSVWGQEVANLYEALTK
jgi:hypothetical protein